ncbi:MAG: pyridoxamine 5'-phosphate oxidase [Cyclobacteriaceae bacterium]
MKGTNDIHKIRKEYTKKTLELHEVNKNPLSQFRVWFDEALQSKEIEPNAMIVSTVKTNGTPSARVLLIKEITPTGMVFYTNYESNKGKELEANPAVCATFFWPMLERQVRIEGVVKKYDAQKADTYFKSRPLGSQIGAISSPQSQPIERETLEQLVTENTSKYSANAKGLKRPENWGGYIIEPNYYEFWQGRASRLHDRIVFEKKGDDWKIDRLAP